MDLSEADLNYECPVCLGHILPPVFQCYNGHLICEACLPKVHNCPVCQDALPKKRQIRSLETEKIIKRVTHPCPFEDKGCQARIKYDAFADHKYECSYGSFPICSIVGIDGGSCKEEVAYSDFHRHLEVTQKFKFQFPKDKFGVHHFGNVVIVPIPADKQKRSPFYLGSITHEGREIVWIFKFLLSRQDLALQFFVLRGNSFVSRCHLNLAIQDQNKQTRITWNGPCLSLQRTQEELDACFSTPWACLKRWITKDGNEERLNIWWKLTLDDPEAGKNPTVGTSSSNVPPADEVKST